MPDNTFKILIADDIGMMRSTLRALLAGHGLKNIEEAVNGEDALKRFTVTRHSLIMLDIDMPKMSGMEVLNEIRKHDRDTYIVMVSAHSSVDNVKQAMAQGVNAFVVKPYSAKKIEAVLQKFAKDRNISLKEMGNV
jgi:YesN/AraC family two-component response regulator